jgi:hypothetical protein
MILRWAKERLNDMERKQAARDTVLLIAQYNYGNMDLAEGKWITRDFAQKFNDWNMRCFQLINSSSLLEEVRHSSDWALLLAVERLAIDFFYSGKPDQTHFLINVLMENPKMVERALGMAMSVQYYRYLRTFPAAGSVQLNFDLLKGKKEWASREMEELAWLWPRAIDKVGFKEERWEEWYAKNSGGEKRFILPRILLNVSRLERMIAKPVIYPDEGQRRRGEIIKVGNDYREIHSQLAGFVESKLAGPFVGKHYSETKHGYDYLTISMETTWMMCRNSWFAI